MCECVCQCTYVNMCVRQCMCVFLLVARLVLPLSAFCLVLATQWVCGFFPCGSSLAPVNKCTRAPHCSSCGCQLGTSSWPSVSLGVPPCLTFRLYCVYSAEEKLGFLEGRAELPGPSVPLSQPPIGQWGHSCCIFRAPPPPASRAL